MALEDLLFPPLPTRTSYAPSQLRNKLTALRAGMALHLPKGQLLPFRHNTKVPKEAFIAAIDAELAAFAALDRLVLQVAQARQTIEGRLPVLAEAIQQFSSVLKFFAGNDSALRKRLGVAPGKKRRRLRPAERVLVTAKLNATRKRNGTASRKPRKR